MILAKDIMFILIKNQYLQRSMNLKVFTATILLILKKKSSTNYYSPTR